MSRIVVLAALILCSIACNSSVTETKQPPSTPEAFPASFGAFKDSLLALTSREDPVEREVGLDALWDSLRAGSSFPFVFEDSVAFLYRGRADNVRFVGAGNAGDGSPNDPYKNIEEAIAEAPDHATLIFKAGSVNTFAASTLVIDRPFTLRGYNAVL